MKSLADLREEVLGWMDEAGDTDTSKTIVENALNQSNQQRSTQLRWPWMLSRVYTFTTVGGQSEYFLAEGALKLDYIRNRATKRNCIEISDEELVASDRDFGPNADAGSELYFQFAGYSPIKQPLPTAGDTLTVTSSASETAAPSFTIEGEDGSGEACEETVAYGGTSSTTFTRVTRITRSGGTPTGTLTLSTTGGLTLVSLTPAQKGKQYPIIRFILPCSGGAVIEYRYIKVPKKMTADGDLPDVPFPYSNILVWDALVMIAAYNEVDSEASSVWKANRDNWEQALLASALHGDVAGGMGESIRHTPETYSGLL